jgi:hypothetical protein
MVDVKQHNAEVDAMRASARLLEHTHARVLPLIDKLDPPDRIKLLNRLLLAYGVRRSEIDL